MAIVRAFRALRPDKKYAADMISLPYDVMSREEASRMAMGNPVSFLHICRSEIDLPDQENVYSEKVYRKAKDNIDDFIKKGVLIRDEKPMLYIYRQIKDGRVQTGITACVSVDEYQNGIIKKHEKTRVEKEQDRIDHFDTCSADTEPVFLTYRDNMRIRMLVEGWIFSHDPEYDIKKEDVEHILWKIDDDIMIENLTDLFKDVPALYIADGHHRSASACKVGMKRRKENKDYDGSEEFNYFMAVLFPDSDLMIYDYNRVVKDLNGLSEAEFIKRLKEAGFSLEEKGKIQYYPSKKHIFSMFMDGKWYKLTFKDDLIPDDIIDSLDVSILQDRVLAPVLGIENPRTDKRIDFIGGIRGLKELEKRCSEDMKVAFAIHPVDMADLLKVADMGRVMPPKSTWFEPKLGSGLFMHEI